MQDRPPFDIPQLAPEKPQGDTFLPPVVLQPDGWAAPQPKVDMTEEQKEAYRKEIDEGAARGVALMEQRRQSVLGLDKAAIWKAWETQCGQRKQWIASKKADYDRVKQERVEALQQFNTYWDTKLNAARSEYDAAKAYPVPARPA